jgi:hypothetical protein
MVFQSVVIPQLAQPCVERDDGACSSAGEGAAFARLPCGGGSVGRRTNLEVGWATGQCCLCVRTMFLCLRVGSSSSSSKRKKKRQVHLHKARK